MDRLETWLDSECDFGCSGYGTQAGKKEGGAAEVTSKGSECIVIASQYRTLVASERFFLIITSSGVYSSVLNKRIEDVPEVGQKSRLAGGVALRSVAYAVQCTTSYAD